MTSLRGPSFNATPGRHHLTPSELNGSTASKSPKHGLLADHGSYDQFEYQDLDYRSQQIRLLQIAPDLSHEGFIQCTLRNTRLADRHLAVSYTWGPQTLPYTILINGKSMHIRRNLWNFLCVARRRYHSIPLWVDAVCISIRRHYWSGIIKWRSWARSTPEQNKC